MPDQPSDWFQIVDECGRVEVCRFANRDQAAPVQIHECAAQPSDEADRCGTLQVVWVPIVFCPWCGLRLADAAQTGSPPSGLTGELVHLWLRPGDCVNCRHPKAAHRRALCPGESGWSKDATVYQPVASGPDTFERECIAVVVDLAARDPYGGSLGCMYCSGQQGAAHDAECVWARALDLNQRRARSRGRGGHKSEPPTSTPPPPLTDTRSWI